QTPVGLIWRWRESILSSPTTGTNDLQLPASCMFWAAQLSFDSSYFLANNFFGDIRYNFPSDTFDDLSRDPLDHTISNPVDILLCDGAGHRLRWNREDRFQPQ